MSVSKFGKKKTVLGSSEPTRAPRAAEQPREVKKRRPRQRRMFSYRGVSFIVTHKDNKAVVQTYDDTTNQPLMTAEVPKEHVRTATKILAKIQLAEEELEAISIKTGSKGF